MKHLSLASATTGAVETSAHAASRLRYVSDQHKGYSRRLRGKHFIFFDGDHNRIHDEAEIARIRKLAIPPAYRDVWICPFTNGHIQATGIDAKGRKQYRYHEEWRRQRDMGKFERLRAFGEALPQMRQAIATHMAQHGLGREKVLATVVSLLEKTLIRVGNDEYARNNNSYGLTTLQSRHVELSGQVIRFLFKGKSGKTWQLKLSDRRLAAVIRKCEEIEGQELFKYLDDSGHVHDVTSGDVNAYLRQISGEGFSAKDFRTWAGTVFVAAHLKACDFETEKDAKTHVVKAIEAAAGRLGNTPAICRKCYVHPVVISRYLDKSLSHYMGRKPTSAQIQKYLGLTPEEIELLSLLRAKS